MSASPFDSALYSRLFPTRETGRLFTDSAELRALLIVEAGLAEVQGRLGVIPEVSAAAIRRAAHEIVIDPGSLAVATGQNGVLIPALLAAFRDEMQAPEHAQYIHWGATSQDIIDSGLMLRLRQVLAHAGTGLDALLARMADLAEAHAELPMAGRTWGQQATPVSFGAGVARWGAPLLALRDELSALREQALWVSLSGAAGSGAALGANAATTRAALADALGLVDPGRCWHGDRTPVLRIGDWLTRLALALAKPAEDITLLAMGEIGEVRLGGSGASSTMPQKQNPVRPGAIIALSRLAQAQLALLQGSGAHRLERDGAAWMVEWLGLPQLCLAAMSALTQTAEVFATLAPDSAAMARNLAAQSGLIHAEALSFRLARSMRRTEAQAAVKALCRQVAESGEALEAAARAAHPDLALDDVFDPARQLGEGPVQARAFAAAVRAAP